MSEDRRPGGRQRASNALNTSETDGRPGRRWWATTVSDDGGRRRWAMTVGDGGGQRWRATKVGDDGGQRRWATMVKHKRGRATRGPTKSLECIKHERDGRATRTTTVGDDGGRRRWATTVKHERGWATRGPTKSLERVKHERGGTGDDGGRQGNQSDLYESEVVIEAKSRDSHALNTSEGEGGCKVGCERARL